MVQFMAFGDLTTNMFKSIGKILEIKTRVITEVVMIK